MRSLQKATVSVDQHLAVTLPNLLEEKNKLYKTLRVVCPPANIVQLSLQDQIFLLFLLPSHKGRGQNRMGKRGKSSIRGWGV